MSKLNEGKKYEISSIHVDVIDLYTGSSLRDKDLPCELYQLKFFMDNEHEWNPNPIVGVVQLGVFSSFIQNQIKWELTMRYFYKCVFQSEIQVRGEKHVPKVVFSNHSELLNDSKQVKKFMVNQRAMLQDFEDLNSYVIPSSLQASLQDLKLPSGGVFWVSKFYIFLLQFCFLCGTQHILFFVKI